MTEDLEQRMAWLERNTVFLLKSQIGLYSLLWGGVIAFFIFKESDSALLTVLAVTIFVGWRTERRWFRGAPKSVDINWY